MLLLMLLAVFMGSPMEHCAESCAHAAHAEAADSLHALRMSAAQEGCGHQHLPCIHQREGELYLQTSGMGERCSATPPPVYAYGCLAAVVWVRMAVGLGRCISPAAVVRLPMLC